MAECDLLIRDCAVLQPDLSLLRKATIGVRADRIVCIETDAQAASAMEAPQVLDGSGKLAMPGLVDAHAHVAQQLLRGSLIDELPILRPHISVPFERHLTREDAYAGARLFCAQSLKAGITCFADVGGPHMDAVIQAVLESGIRATVGCPTMDQGEAIPSGIKETAGDAVARTEELHRDYHGSGNGRVRISFGLRQIMSCSAGLIEAVSFRSKELGIGVHAHLADNIDEVSFCLTTYKMRPTEWLDFHGMVGPSLIAAHAIRLADREAKLLCERGANVVLCPRADLESNGFAKVPFMMALGVNIGLGTDGALPTRLDLFEQLRLLKYAMHARYGTEISDPLVLPSLQALLMVTSNGARALTLQDEIGALELGKRADIILLSIAQSHISPTADLVKGVALTACAGDVCDVIVDGRLLVKERVLMHLDEEGIRRAAGAALLRAGRRAELRQPFPYIL